MLNGFLYAFQSVMNWCILDHIENKNDSICCYDIRFDKKICFEGPSLEL